MGYARATMRAIDWRPLVLLVLWPLLGCDGAGLAIGTGPGAASDEGPRTESDRDGDGVQMGTDCNDHQAVVYPGAPEVFDGFDNDCDGAIDEDGADMPAFEGYGRGTVGGAGGTVVRVTTLADDGPGSLRAALVEQAGPTIIEFDVAGEIALASNLRVSRPFLTINGASAPEPGITLRATDPEAGIIVAGTHQIILTHLRIVGTHTPGTEPPGNEAVLGIDGDTPPDGLAHDIVFDHLTISNAPGGGPDLWGEIRDVTVSYCLVYDSWSGTSVSYFGGSSFFVLQRISLHHNAYVDNQKHNPQFRADVRDLDFVDNVVVGWSGMDEQDGGGLRIRASPGEPAVDANLVDNFYDSEQRPQWAIVYGEMPGPMDGDGGPAAPASQGAVVTGTSLGSLWVAGNRFPSGTVDQFSTVDGPLEVPADAQVQVWPAEELVDATLPWVGVRDRTSTDRAKLDRAIASF